MFNNIYKGKKVLVTGHCGFCGSWVSLWLKRLGADVIGYGHPPTTEPSHHILLGGYKNPIVDYISLKKGYCQFRPEEDLLNYDNLETTIQTFKPDLVLHLAAKAIIPTACKEPRETFNNNVMGAVNLFEACRLTPSVKGIVAITSDKVYENKEWNYAYREIDELGGIEPYSASKVCVEQVIRCYRETYGLHIATARAGNVIGGGDWNDKRIIPDIARATSLGKKVVIHTPNATRPFQHVLEALSGYLLLGQKILEGEDVNRAWNFGPEGEMSVLELVKISKHIWPSIQWEVDDTPTHPHMVYLLKIDSTESKKLLGWKPVWNTKEAVVKTVGWYKDYYQSGKINSNNDIDDYEEACNAKL